ncbi:replicative DNA helicase [Chengkuizengella marina]|uniref:DNA 5'-3' helicase n=1 Tax=Chengkuizengella marina TaxID=2507566 RepID=A0A6N9PXS8_9BACL|nr:DnaB-like helicase C-terminal domain-containing protein [Chengkuizengella marina]NBI28321.1 replicative DNA helicase [Chengkuizengella marina]
MNSSINEEVLKAEQSVIGAVFIENKVLDDIANILEPRDFVQESHKMIWKGIKHYYQNNIPIDLVTIVDALNRYGRLTEVGGVKYLNELAESCPTTANVEYYADIVKSKAMRRRGIEAGKRIKELSEDEEIEDDEQYFAEVEKIASELRPSGNSRMKHVSEIRKDYLDDLKKPYECIPTGFYSFDAWSSGIGRGWLYVLAGRPSVGKTAKMLQMVQGIARHDAGEVVIFSQEMKSNQLISRMISANTAVNMTAIRKKELDEDQIKKINLAYDKLEKLPIHIEDAKNFTIEEVRATARQIKRTKGRLGAIVVDYLTIMNIPQSKGETRSQAVGRVTRTAKQIALELDCPFIMLAQMSREGGKAEKPKLEHLRDSGEIEQDADVVEFLWHDPEDTDKSGKVIQSFIAKGRDIGINEFRYIFKGWIQTFNEPLKP